jgi:hypothetical protein
MCHDARAKFNEDYLRMQKLMGGGGIHRHTDSMEIA